MKVHRGFWNTGRSGSETKQRHVVAPSLHGIETHRLVECDAVEFGIMVCGSVEADHLLEKAAALGAGDHLVHQPRVAECDGYLRLVDDLGEFTGTQHWHGIDDNRASLGRCKPARDHRGIVGRADQHAVARLHTIVLDQSVREAIGPVREFLVGAAAAIADQRRVVAESLFHHPVGQLDCGVEVFGVVEAVEQKIRPLVARRQVVARERIDVSGGSERVFHHDAPIVWRAITTFWTSDAPS